MCTFSIRSAEAASVRFGTIPAAARLSLQGTALGYENTPLLCSLFTIHTFFPDFPRSQNQQDSFHMTLAYNVVIFAGKPLL